MSEKLGDLHNFGQAVTSIIVDGQACIAKPRTLFWESFFFGSGSPLASVFANSPLSSNFSIVHLQKANDVYQHRVDENQLTQLDFYQYGYLLGFCFFFGIQDLHLNNVLRTPAGAQPIDVETVFSGLVAPSQTLLIPGTNIKFARTPLAKYMQEQEIHLLEVTKLVQGFVQLADVILLRAEEIENLVPADWQKQRNRVIFRDTQDYAQARGDYFEEERIQLARGDIPYFFKLGLSDKVFYCASRERIEAVRDLPANKSKIANTVGKNPKSLFDREYILARKLPVALLSVSASFRSALIGQRPIEFNGGEMQILENSTSLKMNNQNFELKF